MRIIPGTRSLQQTPLWQTLLSRAITDPEELLRLLDLPLDSLPASLMASQEFRLRVPRGFAGRMRKGDPNDPLLLQVLPSAEELAETPGFSHDPLDELSAMPVAGVLHKYQGRLLLTATGACAVHCRYCFRRHYPYSEANPGRAPEQTFEYVRQHTEINEVILSGGDPLTLSDTRLGQLVARLETLPHVTCLRIHSRVPVVLPERVDAKLLEWLQMTRLQVVLVIHANHPNEIDASVHDAMRTLKKVGITLLNQSVLLRGVNDNASTLAELSEALFDAGVLPYYLHQLDSVQGAAHYEVTDREAVKLINQLRKTLPGYLLPELVRELPDQSSKTPL
jgi:EF-P beta-lysylation protein EpmB